MKFDAWQLLLLPTIQLPASLLDIGFLDFYGATYLMSTSWVYALILIRPTTGLGTTWANTVGFHPIIISWGVRVGRVSGMKSGTAGLAVPFKYKYMYKLDL
jgi:hypothetical protein